MTVQNFAGMILVNALHLRQGVDLEPVTEDM